MNTRDKLELQNYVGDNTNIGGISKAHLLRDGLQFKPAKVKEDLKKREN